MKLTAIPDPTALRLDTTVGTRVFAGDIMIYGNTGRREITDTGREGWLGTPYIQRLGDIVYVTYTTTDYLRPDPDADVTNHPFLAIPPGFQARSGGAHGLGYLNGGYPTDPNFIYGSTTLSTMRRRTDMYGTLSWVTYDRWPTTLPGIPA